MDTLRSLGFCVDIANQHLKNHSTTINLQLRDSNTEVNKIEIYPESEQVIELKVSNIKNGEAMLPAVNLGSCSIQQGVVEVRNGKALCTVTNPTVQKLNLCYNPLTLEELHKNYDFKVTDSNLNNFSSPTKFNFNLIRTQHMNEEEKFMLENLLKEFEEVFHMEGNPLTFTNKIKHKINTTNEDPIYTKPYRYPAVHREEVRAQINKMLEEISSGHHILRGLHQFGSSPKNWTPPEEGSGGL
ncbi:hypothetical protein M8J77_003491 [Diaphorina citri]|nr:hypothetical protein M8J77_003491 [Diaphorina citri]